MDKESGFVKIFVFFANPLILFCNRRKICYNIGMQKGKYQKRNTNASVPLFAPTQAKASGLAFSVSTLLVLLVGLIFSVAVIIKFGVPTEEKDYTGKDWYLYVSYLIPQMCLLAVAIGYFVWLKKDVKQTFKEQKCHPKYFLWAVLLQLGLFSLGELNGFVLLFMEKVFGQTLAVPTLPKTDGFGIVWVILVIGVLPAVFEEFFFRGILLKGLRSFGKVGAILLCGALFSLYHQNPSQTVYQFLCGCAFALVAVRSGSILPTVVAHFINNTVIIVLETYGVTEFPLPVYITVICVTAVCLVASLVYLLFFDKNKNTEDKKEFTVGEKDRAERWRFFACASFGLLTCAFVWITNFMSGFLG